MQIENEVLLQVIIWLGSFSILLLGSIGTIAIYIYRTYKSDHAEDHARLKFDNDSEHAEIKADMCIYRTEIRQDIKDVHSRIDNFPRKTK
jgi:hypothetical protein